MKVAREKKRFQGKGDKDGHPSARMRTIRLGITAKANGENAPFRKADGLARIVIREGGKVTKGGG